MLQELLNRLQQEHQLSPEQAAGILATVTNFIKEKFPMFSGAVDSMFQMPSTDASDALD